MSRIDGLIAEPCKGDQQVAPTGQKTFGGVCKYDPDIHHRHTIRLRDYDYSQAGAYFVTLCTQGRECLFGDIVDRKIRMNDAGEIVAREWIKTEEIRNNIELDEWVIMPNHFHAILVITDREQETIGRGDLLVAQAERPTGRPHGPQPQSIGAIMAGFKSATTKRINERRQTYGVPLWQRNYWEHVIRSEPELNGIREYILNNPAQWELDTLYGVCGGGVCGNDVCMGGDVCKGDQQVAPTGQAFGGVSVGATCWSPKRGNIHEPH